MWFRISILTLGTFAVGTDGFVVAGVLGDISQRTQVSVATAGQLVTLFALVYAVASPVTASLFGSIPRRTQLLSALGVFTVGNVMAAVAPSYAVLAAGRVVAAVGAAMYTPNASVAATALAPDRARGRALAVVMGGLTVATIVGVPFGTFLGGKTGFHGVFWLVTALGLLALIGLAVLLPAVPAPPAVGLRQRLGMLAAPGVSPTLLITTLQFIGSFTVYTYITPMLSTSLHAGSELIATLLICWGLGGAIGNALGGWISDRWGVQRATLLSLVLAIATLGLIPLAATHPVTAGVDMFIWGIGGWMLVPAQQHRLISLAPKAAPLVISLNASAMYIGIGTAGAIGGAITATLGARAVGPAGAVADVVALIFALAFFGLSGGGAAPDETKREPSEGAAAAGVNVETSAKSK